jgi:hypothetical protein
MRVEETTTKVYTYKSNWLVVLVSVGVIHYEDCSFHGGFVGGHVGWIVLAMWNLKLKWMAACVCGCARALLVGIEEELAKAWEIHGKVLSDCMHYLLRQLELRSHIIYDFLYVDDMTDGVVSGYINFGVDIMVDVHDELCEFAIELLFPLLHGFGEEGFNEVGISVGVAHGLKLLGNRLLSWWASETEGILVGV